MVDLGTKRVNKMSTVHNPPLRMFAIHAYTSGNDDELVSVDYVCYSDI